MPERLLVVRLGAMGDIIHTLPAVASLRRSFPQMHIGWVVEERWRELLCAQGAPLAGERTTARSLADCVHLVNTFAWRVALFSDETWRAVRGMIRELRASRYEMAVDWQGSLKSAVVARLSGAASIAGFETPREAVAKLFYNRSIAARGAHIIEQNLSLAEALGAQPMVSFDLPRDDAAEAWCERELARRGVSEFAILNPGAGWGAKCWPLANYAEVARALAARGMRSLINHGPAETQLAAELAALSGGAAEPIAGSVGELVALMRRARLLVAGDTGPLHLAAALGVPVVGIYGPTDPERNGPYSSRAIVLRSPASATTHSRRAQPDAGLLSITAAEVIHAAERLLAGERV